MRLLSFLGLSYAAVATALTNVGFGGKRGSNKHFQDLDLGLDCDSDRCGAVAKYLPDRAHDIAFTKRVGSAEPVGNFTRERFVTTPVAWKRVADATTIAALQVPGADGTKVDVFKSSVSVAREVGQYLHDHL